MCHQFVKLCILIFLQSQFTRITGRWVSTAPTREFYEDGKDGSCQYFGETNPICPTRWVNRGTTDGGSQSLSSESECSFFTRLTTFVCYKRSGGEGQREEACMRKRYFYFMKTECYGLWLHWEDCDADCGGGISRRYRYLGNTNTFVSQERMCNGQSCPFWGRWEGNDDKCDKTCTNVWSRECFYSGESVDPKRCPTDFSVISRGNLTHQAFPCIGEGCSVIHDDNLVTEEYKEPTPPDPRDRFTTTTKTPPTTTKSLDSNALTKTTTAKRNVKKTVDEFSIEYDTPLVHQEKIVFLSKTFWVGVAVGAAGILFLLTLIFLIFSCTRKGKSTFVALNTEKEKQKHHDQENGGVIQDRLTAHPQNGKTEMSRSGSNDNHVSNVKVDVPSTYSEPFDRENNSKSYESSTGSASSQSGENQKKIKPLDAEPYYTPIGERRHKNREKSQEVDQIYVHVPHYSYSLSDSSSESDIDDYYRHPRSRERSPPRMHKRDDGAYYYKNYSSNTRRGKHSGRYDYDEEAYTRQYKTYQHDKRMNRSASSGQTHRIHSTDRPLDRSPSSRRRHKHRSVERRATVEYSSREDSYAKLNKRRKDEGRKPSHPDDEMYLRKIEKMQHGKRRKDKSMPDRREMDDNLPPPPFESLSMDSSHKKFRPVEKTPSRASNLKTESEEDFKFPIPPKFVKEQSQSSEAVESLPSEVENHQNEEEHIYDAPEQMQGTSIHNQLIPALPPHARK